MKRQVLGEFCGRLGVRRGNAHHNLVRRFQPKLEKSELMRMVQPRLRRPWGFSIGRLLKRPKEIDRPDYIVSAIVSVVAILVLPVAFEFQAYYTLIHKYSFGNPYVWISGGLRKWPLSCLRAGRTERETVFSA